MYTWEGTQSVLFPGFIGRIFVFFLCIAHCKTTTLHEIHSICRAAIVLGNTDIYSVTDIFVQNLNTKSDQWNTAKPLEVPLNYF